MLVHLEPPDLVSGPIILLDPRRLKVQGPTHPLQVTRERLDPPFIASSSRRMVTAELVIVGTIVVIVPLLTSFALDVVSLLAPIFDLAACISIAYDITQVFFVPILVVLFER
jgi:hypothetical protein